MSVTTATLLAGSFALLGVVVERLLRLIGFLRFDPSGWETKFTSTRNGFVEYSEVAPEQAEMFAKRVEYRFAIDLFNGKEVPTGLRDITVLLVHADGTRSPSRPCALEKEKTTRDFLPGTPGQVAVTPRDTLDVINVPPRQFVHKELEGEFGRKEAVALATGKWERVEFVGQRPKRPVLGFLGSKTYRKTIIER